MPKEIDPKLRDKIVESHRDIAWIKGKIEGHCKTIKSQQDKNDQEFAKLEKRIDILERFRDKVSAVLLFISLGVGSAWMKISKLF